MLRQCILMPNCEGVAYAVLQERQQRLMAQQEQIRLQRVGGPGGFGSPARGIAIEREAFVRGSRGGRAGGRGGLASMRPLDMDRVGP